MADRYQQFVNSTVGERLADLVGLPKPMELRRYEVGQALVDGAVLLGGADGGRLGETVSKTLTHHGVEVHDEVADAEETPRYGALVFDATGISSSGELRALYDFFHTTVRRLGRSARIIVLSTPPDLASSAAEQTAQRALEGFVRSLAKELRAGSTANLLEVAPGAENGLKAPLRFLLSARSAFVTGQRLTVAEPSDHGPVTPIDAEKPLDGKVAVVTGAARGIGESIARTFARDGATVICVDLASAGDSLAKVANSIGGTTLHLDVTAPEAGETILAHATERHGGLDIIVHNAGITRDKTMAGMDEGRWDAAIAVNLTSAEQINAHLLENDGLREGGRIVMVSSMAGIAGNRGQTNYAASKAGVIGHVDALAGTVAERGISINAVAPGFIETDMTDAMPFAIREVGRRISSLGQGGQPVDVAETIGFFAWPDSTWVNGNTLRVCGQNLLGA